MSIDKLITDLISGLAANTAATEANTAICERIVAGQEAAMAKLAESGAATRKPRAAKTDPVVAETAAAPSTSTPAAGEAPADGGASTTAAETPAVHPLLANPNSETAPVVNPRTNVTENTPTANYRASDFSLQQVKNEFIGWLGDTTDPEERKRRNAFVGAIAQHFGVGKPFAPDGGLSDAEQFKQALFYLRREREGLKVDFATDYNFDADPLADQTPAEVEESEEDALG